MKVSGIKSGSEKDGEEDADDEEERDDKPEGKRPTMTSFILRDGHDAFTT